MSVALSDIFIILLPLSYWLLFLDLPILTYAFFIK